MITWNQCKLPGDIPLPVTIVTEWERSYTLVERRRTEEEALRLADIVLTQRLEGYLPEGEVLSRELSYEVVEDTLLVTLTAECEEQIGKFVEIPKE